MTERYCRSSQRRTRESNNTITLSYRDKPIATFYYWVKTYYFAAMTEPLVQE